MPHINRSVADFLDSHTYSNEDPVRFVVAARDFMEELENPADQRQFIEHLIQEVGSRNEQPVTEQVVFLLNRELLWLDDPS